MVNLFKLTFEDRNGFTYSIIKESDNIDNAITEAIDLAERRNSRLVSVEQVWYGHGNNPNLKHQYNMWKFKKKKNKLVR